MRGWVIGANVRWGVDAAHRASFQQPPFKETTWRFGLDRLLLGYAMPGEGRVLFRDTLPFDDVEGSEAELLGRLASFCEALFDVQRSLGGPRTIEGWRDALGAALDRMIAEPDHGADELQAIRGALYDLAEEAHAAGFDEPVPLHVVRAGLEAHASIARPGGEHAFLSGGVTVCALLPMRSIPSRVVCLLGMNDGAFPRQRRAPSFDLVAKHPRRGDRSPRDEDRYLFLEAILSARSRLLVTYVGRSMKDNAEIPPAVVVSELLDVLDESFAGAEPDAARRHVVVVHPLQPFSPAYFRAGGDARVFSYAARYRDGARALLGRDPRAEAPASSAAGYRLPPRRAPPSRSTSSRASSRTRCEPSCASGSASGSTRPRPTCSIASRWPSTRSTTTSSAPICSRRAPRRRRFRRAPTTSCAPAASLPLGAVGRLPLRARAPRGRGDGRRRPRPPGGRALPTRARSICASGASA